MDFFFLTTEYTEAGEPILKDTERSSVYSVWERSDLSVYSVVKWGLGISRVERVEICRGFGPHFAKCGPW